MFILSKPNHDGILESVLLTVHPPSTTTTSSVVPLVNGSLILKHAVHWNTGLCLILWIQCVQFSLFAPL